jgi:hypothetical protein
MNKRIGLLAAGGLAAALVAGGGTALAASTSPISGTGVITGCYTNAAVNGSHAVVLQNGGTSCPQGTSAITWDQTGPAGPTGPAGATGATGAAGSAGATGAQGTNGTNGSNGANGTSIVTSPGFPPSPCVTGDSDVDLADGEVYTCTASAWVDTDASIEGPAGPQGPAGAQGPAGPQGPAGTGSSPDIDYGSVSTVGSASASGCVNLGDYGPDAGTIQVTNYAGGCEISGLPFGFTFLVTDDGGSAASGAEYLYPTAGGMVATPVFDGSETAFDITGSGYYNWESVSWPAASAGIATPDNSCSDAIGIVPAGVSALGINVGDSAAWYSVDASAGQFVELSGSLDDGVQAGTDVMNIYTSCTGTAVTGGSGVFLYDFTSPGTYYVEVTEGAAGADGGFVLGLGTSS